MMSPGAGPSTTDVWTSLTRLLERDRFHRIKLVASDIPDVESRTLEFSVDNDRSGLERLKAFLEWACTRARICAFDTRLYPYWIRIRVGLARVGTGAHDLPDELGKALDTAVLRGTVVRDFRLEFPLETAPPPEPERPTPPRPAGESAVTDRALSLYREGRYEEALGLLGQISPREADTACVHYIMGLSYDHLDMRREAESHLRKAVKLAPDEPSYHYDLAVCLTMQDRNDQALPEYARTLALAPEHADAANNAGWISHEAGAERDALYYLQVLLALEREGKRADAARPIVTRLLRKVVRDVATWLEGAQRSASEATPERLGAILAPALGQKTVSVAHEGEGAYRLSAPNGRSWRLQRSDRGWSIRDSGSGLIVLSA